MQTRLWSLIEVCINVAIGFGVALLAQIVIFPIYDMQVSIGTNLQIGAWFTGISIARSYCVRRGFNWFHGLQSRIDSPAGVGGVRTDPVSLPGEGASRRVDPTGDTV